MSGTLCDIRLEWNDLQKIENYFDDLLRTVRVSEIERAVFIIGRDEDGIYLKLKFIPIVQPFSDTLNDKACITNLEYDQDELYCYNVEYEQHAEKLNKASIGLQTGKPYAKKKF
ncbi:unnamed protein product [Caenorhabditis auriculariae]|uniref:Uncharacterized protein n=1 Tax=Caenorhabditis auriculariae TaxID=2777116 RepID=A0A8S1HA44_9PELO|nr:unnamed protein product [Caenorhabditis auriculariae]